jgi:hypothetical protein
MIVLAEAEWLARRDAHVTRVRRWTGPHQRRRAGGQRHPVLDFLFDYYSFRPSCLERWHPGPDVVLAGDAASAYLRWPTYRRCADGVTLDLDALGPRLRTATFVRELLTATAGRKPRLGCFGMHEWAMVYRQTEQERRHPAPLRLGAAGTDAVVESMPVRCSHFDAFRFFTPQARPRNAVQLTRADQVAHEQPGCLHAGMDLYKWATKLDPFTPSDLIARCFELAVDIRTLDMRASPYDLTAHGYEPVAVELERGRAEYARAQAGFADRAGPLRAELIALCGRLISSATTSTITDRRGC